MLLATKALALALCVALPLCAGCYCSHVRAPDGGDATDAGRDATFDSGTDAGTDAGVDAGPPPICTEDVRAERERLRALLPGLGYDTLPPEDGESGTIESLSDREASVLTEAGVRRTFRWIEDGPPLTSYFSVGSPATMSQRDGWHVLRSYDYQVDVATLDLPEVPPPIRRFGIDSMPAINVSFVPRCTAVETGACVYDSAARDLQVEYFGETLRVGAGESTGRLWTYIGHVGAASLEATDPECSDDAGFVGIVGLVSWYVCIC